MTKTAAAKAFAETHGQWDPALHMYEPRSFPRSFPRPSETRDLTSDLTRARADTRYERDLRDAARNERDAARKDRDELLTTVISLLGLEDQYPDRRVAVPSYALAGTVTTTVPGAKAFAADLRKAASAIDGQAALKRLRKAAKNTQKEQNS